jgi:serine protease
MLTSLSTACVAYSPSDQLFRGPGNAYDYQWGLHTLKLPQAWNYVRGTAYVAVLDGGIDTNHPDLQENFRPHLSYDFYNNRHNVDERSPYSGGRIVDLVGHGTHVAGILAATANNRIGGAGVCLHCSLMIGKISYPKFVSTSNFQGFKALYDLPSAVAALRSAVDTGAQVVNMSFGQFRKGCSSSNIYTKMCAAIQHADMMDVVMVAAAGNTTMNDASPQFPAAHGSVISVHAVNHKLHVPGWSPKDKRQRELAAPGVDIVSTFYPGYDYIPRTEGDAPYLNNNIISCAESISAPSGYGPCDGSSMAAPHVAGVAALLRSANPLLRSGSIRQLLRDHASHSVNANTQDGYGVPDALKSVKAALGQVRGRTLVNRLTPLFSLYSEAGRDHFYTTSPQMAMAALHEKLHPQPHGGIIHWRSQEGSVVPGYPDFPRRSGTSSLRPRASVYIFTTHRHPTNSTKTLAPLYRLSRTGVYTGGNTRHVDHVYASSKAEVAAFKLKKYKLDGIEGYILPRNTPASERKGAVKLYRKYNASRDDHAIFPASMLSAMISAGYSRNSGLEWIGYVYPNRDSDSDGLIDGFEQIIGTSVNNRDSDGDDIADGTEVNSFPYSDPLGNRAAKLIL